MEPTPELLDTLYREEVATARRMSPEEKLRAGGELFDAACDDLRATIRACFPEAPEETVTTLLRHVIRAAEQGGVL